MAETVLPSVRGRRRLGALVALTTGAAAAAALTGFVFGVAGQGLMLVTAESGPAPERLVVGIVAAGLTLDVVHLITGGAPPISLGRQVPREWGRLLPLPVTAVLYGARLGVGPLTILSTWTWWAAVVAASAIGVWTTVMISTLFALCRMLVNAVAGFGASPALTGSLIRRRQNGWATLTTAGMAMVAVIALSGCGVADRPSRPILIEADPVTQGTIGSAVHDGSSPWNTLPAQLEDFVRTQTPTDIELASTDGQSTSVAEGRSTTVAEGQADEAATKTAETVAPGLTGQDLANLLPVELEGMTPITDLNIDRFLTIEEAAAIQPDPTEEIALLQTRGYQGGWIRAFRSADDDVVVATVYEFRDEAEAEFYLEDGLITIGGYGGLFFDLPQLPDVRGFQQDSESDGESIRTLGGAFFNQNRWHLLYLVGNPTTVTPETLMPALQAFYSSAVGE